MHFHYPGGGFPLVAVAYRLDRIEKPVVPTSARVREQLAAAAENALRTAPTDAQIAHALAEAQAGYPAAVYGWELAPYKISVTVPGATYVHILRYQQAARFLRALGVLRHCTNCATWAIAHEPTREEGVIICDRCGYLAEDWL